MAKDVENSALMSLDFDELLTAELDALRRRMSEHHALMIAATEVDCARRLQEMKERMNMGKEISGDILKENMVLGKEVVDVDVLANDVGELDLDCISEGFDEASEGGNAIDERRLSLQSRASNAQSMSDTNRDTTVTTVTELTEVPGREDSGNHSSRPSGGLSGPVARPANQNEINYVKFQSMSLDTAEAREKHMEVPVFGRKVSKKKRISTGTDSDSLGLPSEKKASKRRQSQKAIAMISYWDQDENWLREAAERQSAIPGSKFASMLTTPEQEEDTHLDRARDSVQRFLRHPATEIAIAVAILSNSIAVGVEVDWTVNHPKETELPIGFTIIGYGFNILFAIEIGLRMFSLMGRFFTGSQWGWNMFDLSLVIASIVEFAIELLYMTGARNLTGLRIVKIVRISPILRVLRVARVVRLLVALRVLIVQILGTLRSVFWAMVLLLLILYAFGMVFAQVASEHIADEADSADPTSIEDMKKYWSSVPRSMFTLYKSITGGVDWENVALQLSDVHGIWVGVFVIYLSFTIFAVLNVVVGVFCQSAIESATLDHENAMRNKMREKVNFSRKIRALFRDMSVDDEADLSYHELEAYLQDEEVATYFETLGIDTTACAWDLFKLLDTDESQCIDVEEFITGMLHLRGPAKVLDVEKLMFENKQMRKQLASFMGWVDQHISQMHVMGSSMAPSSMAPSMASQALQQKRISEDEANRRQATKKDQEGNGRLSGEDKPSAPTRARSRVALCA